MESEKKFNVIYEKWIPVLFRSGKEEMVSLIEVFEKAHEIYSLYGETEVLNIAILRFLLAILYASLLPRQDTNLEIKGDQIPYGTKDKALEGWTGVWNSKKLPENYLYTIREYLNQVEDDFWLFHPERPFWQSQEAYGGCEFSTAKLLGDLLESSNSVRLFQSRSGTEKRFCSYPEATRWILYTNAYDDTAYSHNKKNPGTKQIGVGWLGKLGLVYAKGQNLFQTLWLNFILLDRSQNLWKNCTPDWERKFENDEGKLREELKHNPALLMTFKSRDLLLIENGEGTDVVGYFDRGACKLEPKNPKFELFTIFKKSQDNELEFLPKNHEPSRQIWRDFASFLPYKGENGTRTVPEAGIIEWLNLLENRELLTDTSKIQLQTCGTVYGDKNSMVVDLAGDSMSIHPGLLGNLGETWRSRIEQEVAKIDKLAEAAGKYKVHVMKASGWSEYKDFGNGKADFYSRINLPFRSWLQSLKPESEFVDEEVFEQLHEDVRTAARDLMKATEQSAPASSLFGRTLVVENEKTKKKEKRHYSLVEAGKIFTNQLFAIYPKE